MQKFPPLSLYVHIPWCVQKCPYCDFNSHAQKGTIPEQEYVQHLIADLEADLEKYQASIQDRPLHSIFYWWWHAEFIFSGKYQVVIGRNSMSHSFFREY